MPSATTTYQLTNGSLNKYIMIFGYFTLVVALLIEVVGAYYSITGLAAIFSGAVIPILIMGGVLELGKVTAAVWLKNNWERASYQFKTYLLPAVVMLMLITSMGIFGFLSKAHNDQNLVSGDVLSKIAIYDEKIKIQKDNIESARRALQQMDAAVDQTMGRSTDEKGADKATAIRRSQAKERSSLQNEIARAQTEIVKLNDLRAPIAAEVRKVEAEVGPIKYIAKLIYDDNPDANILEKAVVWMILIIVAVFDPLALVLILAAQQTIRWAQGEEPKPKSKKQSVSDWFDHAKQRARFWDKQANVNKINDTIDENYGYTSTLPDVEPVVDQHTHIPPEDYYRAMGLFDEYPEPKKTLVEATPEDDESKELLKKQWGGFGFPLSSTFDQPQEKQEETVAPESDPLAHIVVPPIHEDDHLHKLAKMMFLGANQEEDERLHHARHQAGEIDRLPWHEIEHINTLPISDGERKQLIERFANMAPAPAPEPPPTRFIEIEPDNVPSGTTGEVKGFGTVFPTNPKKGDMFLRVDQLPSVLYKFNGNLWIEVDKSLSDQHAYDDAYIDHLIEKISTGEYDPDLLSDAERASIEQRLNDNSKQV
jgi:hypothetical protein